MFSNRAKSNKSTFSTPLIKPGFRKLSLSYKEPEIAVNEEIVIEEPAIKNVDNFKVPKLASVRPTHAILGTSHINQEVSVDVMQALQEKVEIDDDDEIVEASSSQILVQTPSISQLLIENLSQQLSGTSLHDQVESSVIERPPVMPPASTRANSTDIDLDGFLKTDKTARNENQRSQKPARKRLINNVKAKFKIRANVNIRARRARGSAGSSVGNSARGNVKGSSARGEKRKPKRSPKIEADIEIEDDNDYDYELLNVWLDIELRRKRQRVAESQT